MFCRFPGMEESTFLSRSFADQGLKIRIRKELRQRRKLVDNNTNEKEKRPRVSASVDKSHHHLYYPIREDTTPPTPSSSSYNMQHSIQFHTPNHSIIYPPPPSHERNDLMSFSTFHSPSQKK